MAFGCVFNNVRDRGTEPDNSFEGLTMRDTWIGIVTFAGLVIAVTAFILYFFG
jgi:hypothetical protein